ncbi:MAG: CheY-like chemotaxis protein [Gammaproteobacteria bacterium]
MSALNILIIEDNSVNLLVAQSLLKTRGLKTQPADNSVLAIARVKEFHEQNNRNFNVITIDCEVPIMDRYTSMATIRSFESDYELSLDRCSFIIGLNAHALQESKDKSLEAGMNVYMTKPIDKELLLKTLKESALP